MTPRERAAAAVLRTFESGVAAGIARDNYADAALEAAVDVGELARIMCYGPNAITAENAPVCGLHRRYAERIAAHLTGRRP